MSYQNEITRDIDPTSWSGAADMSGTAAGSVGTTRPGEYSTNHATNHGTTQERNHETNLGFADYGDGGSCSQGGDYSGGACEPSMGGG